MHEAGLRVVELQRRGVQLAEDLADGFQRKADQEGREAAAREHVEVSRRQQGGGWDWWGGCC